MAGPALVTARLFRAPGVPRFFGTGMVPVASIQLPFTRAIGSVQPLSQRALNRMVFVWPVFPGLALKLACTLLRPVQNWPLERTCKALPEPPNPGPISRLDR